MALTWGMHAQTWEAAVDVERVSGRMWWPWKLWFGALIAGGVLVGVFGLLFMTRGSGPYAEAAVAIALAAELVIAAAAGVTVVLYRAGRKRHAYGKSTSTVNRWSR